MSACGLGYPARPPALSRLAHIRAVLAARLWLQSGQVYADGRAWWRSERNIRAALASNAGAAHLADAEIVWPSLDAGPYAGQTWAVEVELTPKPAARTARIMTGLLAGLRAGGLPDRASRPAGRGPRRRRAARDAPRPDRDPGAARRRVLARGAAVRARSVLTVLVALWLVRKGLRLARYLVSAAELTAAWPVTSIAAVAVAGAWLRGWPPARLYRAAIQSAPMTGIYLIAVAIGSDGWQPVVLARLTGGTSAPRRTATAANATRTPTRSKPARAAPNPPRHQTRHRPRHPRHLHLAHPGQSRRAHHLRAAQRRPRHLPAAARRSRMEHHHRACHPGQPQIHREQRVLMDAEISVNSSIGIRFDGTYTNSDAAPSSFSLNGTACTT